MRLIACTAVFLLALSSAAQAQQLLQQNTLLGGQALSGGSAAPSRQAASVPSDTARAQQLPSGQGMGVAMPPAGQGLGVAMPPAPLYMPGKTLNAARSFTGAPAWTQWAPLSPYEAYPPFGANLFQGYFAGTYYDGMNSEYVIMPGDRILVHIWGAQSYSDTLMVDQQGNILLPEVGPIRVAGMRHGSLQTNVRNYLASMFQRNLEVYVNLLTAQPVAVYVTGFVARPGRYAGGTNDTALYYLDRAGGIIPDRGTYRDIAIQRNGKTVARVDLYSFILHGALTGGMLRDSDVIVVGPKGDSVLADGLIPQCASYESKGRLTGADLVQYAAPLPAVSHVSVTGTRKANPFHVYLSLKDFASFSLADDDKVEFLADRPGETIMVGVSGSILGPTRYPVKRNTTLRSLLGYVQIDPALSDLSGVYVKRKSVVEQQRRAIADALRRLENSVLTATSATQESSAIRVQEAQLIQNFATRVNALEPDGVVVVTRSGVTSDIMLEDGDEIVIPQRSDIVQVAGEVMIPKAIVHSGDMSVKQYVENAGGFTDRADDDAILVVHPNGEVLLADNTNIRPGDLLLVMPRYDSKNFTIFKDIVQMVYQVAIATKVVLSP
jgi:protein involved in polysaccharide export with SLBB domain